MPGSHCVETDVNVPMRSVPATTWFTSCMACSSARCWLTSACMRGSSSRPFSVRATPALPRVSSATPHSCSSARTAWLTPDCV